MALSDSHEKRIVRVKVVDIMHAEIHNRYKIDYLKTLPQINSDGLFEGVDQEYIDRLEHLFLTTIFPSVTDREQRDKSFESLISMLKKPHRLVYLIPSIPRIMFKYAALFPTALKIGLSTVLAYTLSIRLENQMLDALLDNYYKRGERISEELMIKSEDYREAYVCVPYPDVKKMISLSQTVMKAGKRMDLIDATYNIFSDVKTALEEKDTNIKKTGGEPLHENDVAAIAYGMEVLQRVRTTFSNIPPGIIDLMIKVSLTTEMAYADMMYQMN